MILDNHLPILNSISYLRVPNFEREWKSIAEFWMNKILRIPFAFECEIEMKATGLQIGHYVSVCGIFRSGKLLASLISRRPKEELLEKHNNAIL